MAGLSANSGGGKGEESVKPDGKTVDDFHTNSDVDSRPESQHHTLGPGSNQAAAGNHTHRGGDSELLLTGTTISGSRASDAWRLSVNQILVELGAIDSSSA